MLQYMLLLLVICLFWLLLLGVTCSSAAPVILVYAVLCDQVIIWTFCSGSGPC